MLLVLGGKDGLLLLLLSEEGLLLFFVEALLFLGESLLFCLELLLALLVLELVCEFFCRGSFFFGGERGGREQGLGNGVCW